MNFSPRQFTFSRVLAGINPLKQVQFFSLVAICLFAAGCTINSAEPEIEAEIPQSPNVEENKGSEMAVSGKIEKATFGGGCFWCTEAVFQEVAGVKSVESGYAGGSQETAVYKAVGQGNTGHAEVIQISYDPAVVEFSDLVEIFWATHDPTTLNQQGADIGTQYRSVIFYHDEKQKEVAEAYKKQLNESGTFDKPIVTEITKLPGYFPAEKDHQNYFSDNPEQGYCRAVIGPKVEKFRKKFASKLKKNQSTEKPKKVIKTEAQWKEILTDEQFRVARKQGTERSFTNEYWDNKEDGVYHCVCCGEPVFDSTTKYKSGTGWPSYWKPFSEQSIATEIDRGIFTSRTEVKCSTCDAHLGHVFDDGPQPTGKRYCINSVTLKFKKREEK